MRETPSKSQMAWRMLVFVIASVILGMVFQNCISAYFTSAYELSRLNIVYPIFVLGFGTYLFCTLLRFRSMKFEQLREVPEHHKEQRELQAQRESEAPARKVRFSELPALELFPGGTAVPRATAPAGPPRQEEDTRYVGRMLQDPELLDLLLSCVGSAAMRGAGTGFPADFSLGSSPVQDVLDSFPALSGSTNIGDILPDHGKPSDRYASERKMLLKWLYDTLWHRFEALRPADRVTAFARQFLLKGPHRGAFGARTSAGFHGTAPGNILKILHEGLKEQYSGAGVYVADEPALSIYFIMNRGGQGSGPLLRGWRNSAFKDVMVLFGVEVAMDQIPFRGSGCREFKGNESNVAVRYLFVLPKSVMDNVYPYYPTPSIPSGVNARPEMERIFQRLRSRQALFGGSRHGHRPLQAPYGALHPKASAWHP
ncbi:hypothetical protein F4780DRAFT_783471 [Xylariomycetidae sp. FL0641]|nr:hypothetical protein F4780DRAFT_783471 [Xylariomycetidae sp. FL0641]